MAQKPKKIHKFKNDNSNSGMTACGLSVDPRGSQYTVVKADSNLVNCGKCSKVPNKK